MARRRVRPRPHPRPRRRRPGTTPRTRTTRRTATEALGLLGLARRAGAVEVGTEAARRALREGTARLVLIARDAAEGQRRKVVQRLRHGEVPYRVVGTREELGRAVGAPAASALAVTGASFARQLLGRLGQEDPGADCETDRR
ncbi:MAG: hypothetical protein D6701_01520 [Gemmatimonadetes bacterium]|nr:MAG: hypothetical protein D6701_01520 [Gemmatimonadota bacterium]